MADTVARLVALLGLDASEYTRGLNKAERDAQKFATNTRQAILEVGKVLGGLEIGRQIFTNAVDIIKEAAALNDLADATGSSVEALSRLNNQAKIAGADLNQLQGVLLKLSEGMAGADEDSKKVKDTLKLLGVSTRDPAQAIQEIALKLNTYADGVNKVGIAKNLFGKQGAAFLATLKDIAELQDVGASATDKQTAAAENLEKAFRRLSVESTTFRNAILSDVVPAITRMIEEFNEGIKIAGGFGAALKLFGLGINPFDSTAESIKKLRGELDRLRGGESPTFLGGRIDEANRLTAITEKQKQLEFQLFRQRREALSLIDPSNADARDLRLQIKPQAPRPPTGDKDKDKGDKTAKRLLDQELKALDNAIQSERDTLQDRERFLNAYYRDDLLGLRDFYAGRRVALEEATRNEDAALAQQIERLRKFAATAKSEDRIAAETKIADATEKRARLQQNVSTKSVELFLDENRAVKQFKDSIEEASSALANMRGDTVIAAAAGFDFAHRKMQAAINLLAQSANPQDQSLAATGQKILDQTRQLTIQRQQLAKATEEYSTTLDQLALEQDRISLAEATGQVSTLQAKAQRNALDAQYVEILRKEVEAIEAIAAASGKREDIVRAARARLDMEKIASAQLVKDMEALRAIKGELFDTISRPIEDFIVNGGKARDMLKALEKELVAFMVRASLMTLRGQFTGAGNEGGFWELLFGKAGGFNFGSLFGGGAPVPGSAGAGMGPFAWGGVSRGATSLVGEHGPELVTLPAGARVTPNNQLRGGGRGVTNSQVFNFYAPTSSASARQIRNAARDGVMVAVQDP